MRGGQNDAGLGVEWASKVLLEEFVEGGDPCLGVASAVGRGVPESGHGGFDLQAAGAIFGCAVGGECVAAGKEGAAGGGESGAGGGPVTVLLQEGAEAVGAGKDFRVGCVQFLHHEAEAAALDETGGVDDLSGLCEGLG